MHLVGLGHRVTFAGNNSQLSFINEVLPTLATTPLEGYGIQYSSRKAFLRKMISQIPVILFAMRLEQMWILEMTEKQQFDGIISDNRYGLYHPTVPTAILTHQLHISLPFGKTIGKLVDKQIRKMLNRFGTTWLVDCDNEDQNLAGQLCYPAKGLKNSIPIGFLSAQQPCLENLEKNNILILLSGPEPQRSILSNLLWKQAVALDHFIIFVEGSDAAPERESKHHIRHFKRLPPVELRQYLEKAKLVICRSGYSTLMDLARLGKEAICIPTPGQTEQEYLAKSLSERKEIHAFDQNGFDLLEAIKIVRKEPRKLVREADSFEVYKNVLEEWVAKL